MAILPRNIPKKAEPPKSTPVPTFTIEQMRSFGWIYDGPNREIAPYARVNQVNPGEGQLPRRKLVCLSTA